MATVCLAPTAERYGVSAQIGSGVVWKSPVGACWGYHLDLLFTKEGIPLCVIQQS